MTSKRLSSDSPSEVSFSSAMTRWQRLRRLSLAEAWLGVQALVVLPATAFALKRWGLRRVQEGLARTVRVRAARGVEPEILLEAAQRVAWSVEVAARRGPWPANCLQRSVTLWWFLARRGIASEVRIGVRRRPGTDRMDALDFHAWVEHQGEVLNDAQSVRRRFATFDRAIEPKEASWR